jgi:UDP-glucose 4-epimerase
LAKKVVEITGSKSQILKIPYSEAYSEGFEDMLRRVPDISKIQKVLGWAPKISLDKIIEDVKDSRAIKS